MLPISEGTSWRKMRCRRLVEEVETEAAMEMRVSEESASTIFEKWMDPN